MEEQAPASTRPDKTRPIPRSLSRRRAIRIRPLPPALGEPAHVSSLNRLHRWQFAQALHYGSRPRLGLPVSTADPSPVRENVFPFHLPDQASREAWSRAVCWHPSAFHAFQYSAAVHQDLVSRQAINCVAPPALAQLHMSLELLRAEISSPCVDLEMMLLTVGLLATHDLNEEKMKAMYDSAPLCFDPLIPPPSKLRVFAQLDYAEPHAQMMNWVVRKIGGLNAIQMPGLAATAA